MGDLLVVLLPEMAGLIITPGAVAGCVLLLLRSRAPVPAALAFGGAFLVVYLLIAITAILGGATDPEAVSTDTSHGAGLVVGLMFLLGGLWLLIRHPAAGRRTGPPKLLRELRDAGPRRCFVIGIALAVLNPNLFLMMSGMSYIASSSVGPGPAFLATVLLLAAAAVDFLVPVGLYLALGDRARTWLGSLESWVLRHTRGLSLAVLFGFGALFTARGVIGML
ncbi:GAP family protein [Nocardia carnea]|uniref:GAP family protein n=1 Tax=Nocardia carnea TaxID=37328 RepID=UPI002457A218|nr:GAP family protein [Nocardia carnea]